MEIKDYFKKEFTYAVVGASNDTQKYGNIVLLNLKRAGYNVIPINPKEEMIEGIKAYPTINLCPQHIDVVVFVVPPSVTMSVLQSLPQSINNVWMQPGASDDACIAYCQEKNINVIHDLCVMVEKPR